MASASLELPKGIKTKTSNSPEISKYFNEAGTPYINTGQVLSEVTVRYIGQVFNVNKVEYCFEKGMEDGDLVVKKPDLSGHQLKSEKGIAEGYAGLDTSIKLPIANHNIDGAILNAPTKQNILDVDIIPSLDSASENSLVRRTFANLRTYLRVTFDSIYMMLTGDQSVDGVKSFVKSPIVPTPTMDLQAVNKIYVDSLPKPVINDSVTNTTDLWSGKKTSDELVKKVDKVEGKVLSDENFTLSEKTKLNEFEQLSGAEIKTLYESQLDTNAYSNAEKSKLTSITAIFTTALKSAYYNSVSWISTNGSNIIAHLGLKSNPHEVTKTQVGLSNVPNTDFTSAVAANTAKTTNATHTGEVTGSAALTITNKAVTNDKLADMPTNTYKGRVAAGTGSAQDLTAAQMKVALEVVNTDWNASSGAAQLLNKPLATNFNIYNQNKTNKVEVNSATAKSVIIATTGIIEIPSYALNDSFIGKVFGIGSYTGSVDVPITVIITIGNRAHNIAAVISPNTANYSFGIDYTINFPVAREVSITGVMTIGAKSYPIDLSSELMTGYVFDIKIQGVQGNLTINSSYMHRNYNG